MKSAIFMISGICAAAAGLLLLGAFEGRTPSLPSAPVEELAHKLEDAWADHRTVV